PHGISGSARRRDGDGRGHAAYRAVARAAGAARRRSSGVRRELHVGTRRGPDRSASPAHHRRRTARVTPASPLTVGRLVERLRDTLELEPVDGTQGLERIVGDSNASSPGLVLAGYTARFPAQRLQVFGETEITYLKAMDPETRKENLTKFFSF